MLISDVNIELTLRCFALLCAAMAGWSLGQSRPGWQADVEEIELGYIGCGPLPCSLVPLFPFVNFVGGRPLVGTGAMGLLILASLVCYFFGWDTITREFVSWEFVGIWQFIFFVLLFDSAFWLLIGMFILGCLASRLYSIHTGREDFG